MLPKNKRITTNIFKVIMDKGSVVYGSFFVFRYITQDYPQYSFVAPKNLIKFANKRNNLRRKGYNILNLYSLKKNAGIFFYKKEGLKVSNLELKKDIEIILRKVKII